VQENNSNKDDMIQHRRAQSALFCCREYFREDLSSSENGKWIIQTVTNYDVATELYKLTTNDQAVKNCINHFLRDLGLEITEALTHKVLHVMRKESNRYNLAQFGLIRIDVPRLNE
jgi:hypothetical protein